MQTTAIGKTRWPGKLPAIFSCNHQTLLIMRLTVFFVLVAFLQVSASGVAQTVTLSVQNANLKQVLKEIKKQTGYSFVYNDKALEKVKKITISVKAQPLEKALDICFLDQPVTYEILEKIIIIKARPAPVYPVITTAVNDIPVTTADIDIRGTVVNEKGEPVAASVSVKGLQKGTTTNASGEFVLTEVDEKAILVITGVTIDKTYEVAVNGRTTINVQVMTKVMEQQEVVVTALGIKKQSRSITYATQEVSGSKIVDSRETNIANALQGHFSGVQVSNTSGGVSSSARIQIRGANSLSGNNQPLFVVDGVPIRNTNSKWIGYGGADYGNEIADIDLNNVASVTILKGANAAALYGSRAANGVILITTKSGESKQGMGLTFTSNTTMQLPAYFPAYQDKYGQGSNKAYQYVDGAGGGINDNYSGSWGPALDGRLVDQWFGKQQPWVAHPDNVKSFFQTGWIGGNDISVSKQTEKMSTRFSYGDNRQRGTIPFTDETKNTLSLHSTIQITPKLQAQLISNYVHLKNDNVPTAGYVNGNIMSQVIFGGRQIDYSKMRDFESVDGKPVNYYSKFSDNPFWLYKHNTNTRSRDRIFGTAKIQYDINSWMNIMVRGGLDTYAETRKEIVNGYTSAAANAKSGGAFTLTDMDYKEFNLDAILSINKQVSPTLSINANLGSNLQHNTYNTIGLRAAELVVPNIFNIANVKGSAEPSNYESKYEMQSLYGQFTVAYRDFLFLNGTARNDWSSTLPLENASYFYPSVGISVVPTTVLKTFPWIDYMKLRANWAQVGSTASPYQLKQIYTAGVSWNNVPMFQAGNVFPPIGLKPEITTSKEIGINAQFFGNRLGLDITYYHSNSRNQILSVQLPYSSGYATQKINAGNIRNSGLEIGINSTPVRARDFSWDLGVNWSMNKNKVLKLVEGINLYQIGGIWGVNSYAQEGGSYGDILGSAYLRDGEGRIIVSDQGLPLKDPVRRTLGNIMPEWIGNLRSSLRYKNLSLAMLFDFRKGSNIYSLGHRFGVFSGVMEETAAGNIRETGIVFQGVTADGKANTVAVDPQLFYSTANITGINEFSTFDGSYVKFRELSLNYSIPAAFLKRVGFVQSASIGIAGRNLAILKSNMPKGFDPEVTSGGTDSGLGFEYGYIPTNRSFNFKLQVSF